jgi:hypothetical protein
MNSKINSAVLCALLWMSFGPHQPEALAQEPHSFRQTHYYLPPLALLPGQDLRVCAANGGKLPGAEPPPHFPEDMQVEVRLLGADGAELVAPTLKALELERLALCFDFEGGTLGPATGVLPEMVLAEVVIYGFNPSKGFAFVTGEAGSRALGSPRIFQLPAVQAEAPVTPGKFMGYRPQFYLRPSDLGRSSTQVFGPFTLAADAVVELCVADAAKVPVDNVSLNFTQIEWTVEVYGADGLEPLLVRGSPAPDGLGELGGCFDEIGLADLALGGPDTGNPEIVVVILLHANMPENSQSVPVATGKLKLIDAIDPVPLLLPAVQAARPAR